VAVPLKQSILEEAHRLGFILAGVTTPDPPPHFPAFENWLAQGRHAGMAWLASERSRTRRADPKQILPECKSILVLATPYNRPPSLPLQKESSRPPWRRPPGQVSPLRGEKSLGQIAAYALGEDYHLVLPPRLQTLVQFIETQAGRPVPNRAYTDTGPLLERDLAQRAGLGWIGKNTCLIHPRAGSYFLLAEILLGLELDPDSPIVTDHCGTCTRCLDACPTDCILPDRTLDARRCISYLTIENKAGIPAGLRPLIDGWIFGCDICQTVCPWNRFAAPEGDASFHPRAGAAATDLIHTLALTPESFRRRFARTPLQRAKRRGLLRNAAVALGNLGDERALPALEKALDDPEPMVREHARWAMERIKTKPLP
jgi:epoxyqueuosine reductase